ncbi:hypothetical protein OJE16_25180 [Pantoea tagorei]
MELIKLEGLTLATLQNTLKKYLISSSIDDDGDLYIPGSIPIYASFDKDKEVLRLFGSINTKYLDRTDEEIYKFTGKINTASNSVKYSTLGKESIVFEYGIFMNGSVDEAFLINTIKMITNEANDTRALFPLIDEVLSTN